jgi:hypothetical protein
MDTPKDIWHFGRPLLAKQYLGEFDLGLISARSVTDVFSAAVRGQLGKGLGEPAPSIGIVQKAVGRLTRSEILVRVERGEYHVQDDVFLEWLKRPT